MTKQLFGLPSFGGWVIISRQNWLNSENVSPTGNGSDDILLTCFNSDLS